MNKSKKFVEIYNEIHEYMKEKMKIDGHRSFTHLIGEIKNKDYIIKTYENYLLKFAQLRNIIVHENEIIAEPNDFSFSLIKKIRDKLLDPPQVIPLFSKDVNTVHENDSLIKTIRLMNEKSYSKIPLVDNRGWFSGLLTSNAILKWMGEAEILNEEKIIMKDVQAKKALKYREKSHIFEFVSGNKKLTKIIEKYEKIHREGKSFEAFLITANGTKKEKIIGIITNRDIAVVYQELDL